MNKDVINLELNLYFKNLYLLQLDLTNRCNIDCRYCITHDDRKFKADLPLDQVLLFLEALLVDLECSPKLIFLNCNGESTLYPQLIELIQAIEEKYEGLMLFLDTNAVYISDALLTVLSSLRKNRFFLFVSIWGYDEESYRYYHGKPRVFNKVCLNINQLLDHETGNFRVGFTSIGKEMADNERLAGFINDRFLSSRNRMLFIQKISAVPFTDLFNFKETWLLIRPFMEYNPSNPDDCIVRIYDEYYQSAPEKECFYFKNVLVFHHTGLITFCLRKPVSGLLLDTNKIKISPENLMEAYESPRFLQLREQYRNRQDLFEACKYCVEKKI